MYSSDYLKNIFSSEEIRQIFSDKNRFNTWLKVESSLAEAQGCLGLIPIPAVEEIQEKAKIENLDIEEMGQEYEKIGFPILPLIHQLTKICTPETARWIHWGATTQDIVDTGLVLQMREAIELIENQLNEIISVVAQLAKEHRNTIMVGRTFQQHAAPITFGYKAAVWLDELIRHHGRLKEVKKRVLVCQFGGAVGTLSTLKQNGILVRRSLAENLGLEEPSISWHTARDSWADIVFWLALVTSTLAKVANEVSTLMSTEINELREHFSSGRGGSSTMPQKRNPIACPIIIAIGQRLRDLVSSQLAAMVQENERAVAGQSLESLVLSDAFILSSGSLKQSLGMLQGLSVDAERMHNNLLGGGGLLMAEAVMMGLASKIGRTHAHKIVYDAASEAIDSGITFRQALLQNKEIMQSTTHDDLDHLLDPSHYTGTAGEMIDLVLKKLEP